MVELTPWQTYCFFGILFFAAVGLMVTVRFIIDIIVIKKRRYHL